VFIQQHDETDLLFLAWCAERIDKAPVLEAIKLTESSCPLCTKCVFVILSTSGTAARAYHLLGKTPTMEEGLGVSARLRGEPEQVLPWHEKHQKHTM